MSHFAVILFITLSVFSASVDGKQVSEDLIDISGFPAKLDYTARLSTQMEFSNKKNHKVIVNYYNNSQIGFSEILKKIKVKDNQAHLTLGTGKKQKSKYSSLQEFLANSPSAEMQIILDGTVLYPKIGILPAGHSQQTSALLQNKGSDGKNKHWKGYKRKSTVSSFQAVTLSSEIYTSPDNVISHPYEVPLIGPKSSLPVSSLPVADIQPFDDSQEVNRPRHEDLYDERGRRFGTIAPTQNDVLALQSQNIYAGSLQTPAPSGGFQGMPNISGYLPPDTEGAVGPNHYVQQVNSTTQIFAKNGTSLAGPFNTNTLWTGFGGRCESDNSGDAIALYDEQADRWVLTQFAVGGSPEQVCFAVSQTNDPTGSYYLYSLVTQRFPDYYKMGVWPATNNNAYFMGTNSGAANQYDVYAMDRENMLLGNPARTAQYFQSFQNLLVPADNDGALPPPADEPGYFYTIRDSQDSYFNPSPANDSLDIYSFDVDWNTPANTTFTLQAITSAEGLVDFNWTVCGFFVGNCIPQLGSTTLIDSNSWWPQQRFQYRNFGIYGSLVGVWGVNAVASPGKHTAPRWFELRKHTYDTGWNIRQQGTYAPDSTHRFSPSIAMDESQNIGVGYSVTSSSIYPSIRYTVHDNDLDDLGEMESEATMFNGLSAQTHSSGRWGDYASMDVDPSDNCTFWFTTEYIESNNWKTYIGSFKLPGCKEHNILLFDDYSTEHDINVCKADDTTSYDLALSYDFNTATTMSVSGCPAGASCNYSANPITYPSTTSLQFTNLSSASSGAHALTVTATDGGSKTDTESLTLNLFDTLASSPSLSSPANDSFAGSTTPNLSWNALSGAQGYTVQVDDDPAFGSIDFTTTVDGLTSASSGTLATESCYYWRVAPVNLCGTGPASASFRFYTPGFQAQAPVASTDVPINIPTSATPVDHISTLSIAGVGFISDVNLLNLDITHTYVGDLEMVLTSPEGTSVVLMSQADNNSYCGSFNNVDISLDDEGAAAPWPCNPSGGGGTYQPSNPLSTFDGENANGTWTLNVKDPYNGDGGSINGWSLEFESFVDTGNHCPPGFSVGGNVSGLVGSGLVLQNNLGDDLAIAADGSFTFSTYLDDLDPYSVTVLTQPSSPSQTCTVTDGSGNISAANVTNVSVTCTTDPDITFSGTNLTQDVCVNPGPTAIAPVTLTTTAIGGYSNSVTLAFNPALPSGISGGFSTNNFVPAAAPGTDSVLNLTVDNTASAGINTVTVEASGTGATTQTVDVDLNIIYPLSAPALSSPADGSTGVAINTTFSWIAVAGASSYDIDIATDSAFSNIVASANVGTNSYTPGASLSDSTVYYWRVRANDSCGSTSYVIAAFETVGGSGSSTSTTCSTPNLTIPDNSPTGDTDTLNIASGGTITDINISVDASHTWVGDLIFSVTNDSTATSVTIIDRPGRVSSGLGCSRDNIDTVVDDEAVDPVENECVNNPPNPAIGAGPFTPNNPLTAFDGENSTGNWTITASDLVNNDTGTLNEWCVIATVDTGSSLAPADYGDLASSYGVAKHEGAGAVRLGSNWTADTIFSQDGDDTDDDGISASGNWEVGSATAIININASAVSYVACWFDWNNDGSFAAGEKSVAQSIIAGGVDIGVTIPGSSTFGQNGDDFLETRCRLYSSEPTRATETPTGTAASGEVEDYRFGANQLTPVTLTYNKAVSSNNNFVLNWSTATETAVIGFNIHGLVNSQWKKLNNSIIPAKGINAVEFFDYSFNISSGLVSSYFIEEIRTNGTKQKYGPYEINKTYGKTPQRDYIDWQNIRAESDSKAHQRQSLLEGSFDFIKVSVNKTGVYRITYQDLLNAGVDWDGVSANDISLTFENNAVGRVVSDEVFNTGSYIDFIGYKANTLYTDSNVYILKLNSLQSQSPQVISGSFDVNPDAYYMAEFNVDEDKSYTFASPAESPWYNKSLLAYNNEVNWSPAVSLVHLTDNGVNGRFTLHAWGGTDWPQLNDHHLQVVLNNQVKSDIISDGTDVISSTFNLTHEELSNTSAVTFRLPADTGVDYDLVQIDKFSIEYPSKIIATNDSLQFYPLMPQEMPNDIIFLSGFEQSSVTGFVAKGFNNANIISYAMNSNSIYKFSNSLTEPDSGDYKVSLPYQQNLKYFITTESELLSPQIEIASENNIDLSQSYDYLMISHPDFIDAISPLVSYHSNNGLKVLVVNIEDIYAGYSHHRKDASAIKSFITTAHDKTGISAVLLIGSDSYDYKDNLNIGSVSFIPTLYHATDELITFAPVDPLFTDINNDLIPDLAIGRLPVRSSSELQNTINKIIGFGNRTYTRSALFASDRDVSFDRFSDTMINQLPPTWNSTPAYINQLEITGAKQLISNSINNGVTLTSYFGHSGTSTWSFEHLFDNSDIDSLSNIGKPTIISQFGCWNNYFVMPQYNTMAHNFINSNNKGAVAVLGSATLTESNHESLLGNKLMQQFSTSGITLGEAVQNAKTNLANIHPDYLDVLLGWSVLGDPMMIIEN